MLQLNICSIDNGTDFTFVLLDNHIVFEQGIVYFEHVYFQALFVGKFCITQFAFDELNIAYLMVVEHVIAVGLFRRETTLADATTHTTETPISSLF